MLKVTVDRSFWTTRHEYRDGTFFELPDHIIRKEIEIEINPKHIVTMEKKSGNTLIRLTGGSEEIVEMPIEAFRILLEKAMQK